MLTEKEHIFVSEEDDDKTINKYHKNLYSSAGAGYEAKAPREPEPKKVVPNMETTAEQQKFYLNLGSQIPGSSRYLSAGGTKIIEPEANNQFTGFDNAIEAESKKNDISMGEIQSEIFEVLKDKIANFINDSSQENLKITLKKEPMKNGEVIVNGLKIFIES